jgi:hypothetical protein
MTRLSIGKILREDARAEADEIEEKTQESRGLVRLRDYAAAQYDWMDHHSTFETSEW